MVNRITSYPASLATDIPKVEYVEIDVSELQLHTFSNSWDVGIEVSELVDRRFSAVEEALYKTNVLPNQVERIGAKTIVISSSHANILALKTEVMRLVRQGLHFL